MATCFYGGPESWAFYTTSAGSHKKEDVTLAVQIAYDMDVIAAAFRFHNASKRSLATKKTLSNYNVIPKDLWPTLTEEYDCSEEQATKLARLAVLCALLLDRIVAGGNPQSLRKET